MGPQGRSELEPNGAKVHVKLLEARHVMKHVYEGGVGPHDVEAFGVGVEGADALVVNGEAAREPDALQRGEDARRKFAEGVGVWRGRAGERKAHLLDAGGEVVDFEGGGDGED